VVRRLFELDGAVRRQRGAEAALDTAKVQLQEAEEARRQADDALRRTEVRAPVLADGPTAAPPAPGLGAVAAAAAPARGKRTFTVLDRKVSLNQMIGPPASACLFTLAGDLARMRVEAQAAEGDVHKITRGQPAEFTASNAGDGVVFRGRVEDVRLTPVSERGAVFYDVVIDAANQRDPATNEWRLRPGLTASVDVQLRVHEKAWKLPAAAISFQVDAAAQTDAAKARLARWQAMPDRDDWRPVWVVGGDNRPQPVLVRTGGRDARGEPGVQDPQFVEVLEWDPELQPRPAGGDPATYPHVIIGMPPARHGGLFNGPKIKL
jgi:hypothetical protein